MFWKRSNTNRIGRDCRWRSAMVEGLEDRLLFASISTGTDSIGNVITEFTVPGASNTLAYQINASNQAAGYYIDSSGITHGYYRDSDGSIFSPIGGISSVLLSVPSTMIGKSM